MITSVGSEMTLMLMVKVILHNLYYNIYIYTNLPVDVIVRLPHPRSGDSQGQETFLAPSADKQTRSYDADIYGWIKQQNHLRTIL